MASAIVAKVIPLFPEPPSAQVLRFPSSKVFRPLRKRVQPDDGNSAGKQFSAAYKDQLRRVALMIQERRNANGLPEKSLEQIEDELFP